MNALWNLFLATSVRASALIAAILVLRWLLRKRLPAQCFHWLWIVAALRLLAPVAPQTPVSIFNLRLSQPRPIENPLEEWLVRKDEARNLPPKRDESVAPSTAPATARQNRGNVRALFAPIWAGGVLLQLLLLGRSTLGMKRALRRATQVVDGRVWQLMQECARAVSLRRTADVFEVDGLDGPAVAGLWPPRVLLPRGFALCCSDDELRAVLLHECAHLQRFDMVSVWLWRIAVIVHWFNPIAWLANRMARIDTELSCDECVLRHSDRHGVRAYGEALLALAQLAPRGSWEWPMAATFGNKRALRSRLMNIVRYAPFSRRRLFVAGLFVACIGMIFGSDGTSAPQPGQDGSSAERIDSFQKASAQQENRAPLANAPDWAQGWSVIWISLLEDGFADDAEVDLQMGPERTATLIVGQSSQDEPWVEKLARLEGGNWELTLRKADERTRLLVAADCVSIRGAHVEIEGRFMELTETTVRRLQLGKRGAQMRDRSGLDVLSSAFRDGDKVNILARPQADELLALISAQSGTDLLSAPRVTTKFRQRAVIEIISEFRYASAWNHDANDGSWRPAAYETRNCGVTLEVEPRVGAPESITFEVTPQVVQFLGFRDLESGKAYPVKSAAKPAAPSANAAELFSAAPRRHRLQAIFSSQKLATEVKIAPGQTVLIGPLPETEGATDFKSPRGSRRVIAMISARLIPQNSRR